MTRWLNVSPKGLLTDTLMAIADFELAVYPVTAAQFQSFVAQGYREDRWWSEAGRRDRGERTQPYLCKGHAVDSILEQKLASLGEHIK